MKKTLHVIPHSHWDREWYMPFEKHRARLVTLFDDLIETMENDPDYTHYHLDGQYIVIDDYLEIRPGMRERLMKLICDGRISVGPWYVLQDEYLIGGESNVRNMLYGMRKCRELGVEPLMCGYFPDAFGNISQAPQILRGFGIDNAVFGRGVNDVGYNNSLREGSGIVNSELIWRSPDGSEVMGIMFSGWYCNAMELPEDPEALRIRIEQIIYSAEKYALTDHLLGMNGCDHQPVQTDLSRVIATANRVQNRAEVIQSSFGEYLGEMRKYKESFPVYEGEINGQLSSGACPLICTASAHVDIKQDNYRVEHLLGRVAEPISVIASMRGGKYDRDMFRYAWQTLMQNHPHDSICTCSCDGVYDEMKTRFAKAEACTEHLCDASAEYLVSNIDTASVEGDKAIAVFSLDPHPRTVTLKANVDFDPEERVESLSVFDKDGREIPATFNIRRNQFTYTLPRHSFRKVRYVDRAEVELTVTLEGMGYSVYGVKKTASRAVTSIKYTDRAMENQYIAVSFNDNGSIDVTDKRSGRVYREQNLFEDTQDRGNLYNYVQAEGDASVTNRDKAAKISLCRVTPASVTFKAEIELKPEMDITTYVTLFDQVDRVDIRTEVTNRGEDHRLRALFTTDIDTHSVMAEGQFDVVSRSIISAPQWKNPCNAQRMQAFVVLESEIGEASVMIATRGLCEYEVLRDGRNTMALTLLRAIGDIGDWGVFPSPKGQMKGSYSFEYSIIPYVKSQRAEAYNEGYGYAYPAAMAVGTDLHSGTLKSCDKILDIDNRYVRLSAIKYAEDRDRVIVRLFNTHTESVKADIKLCSAIKKARLTDLAEIEVEELTIVDGALNLEVGAKKIITLELEV